MDNLSIDNELLRPRLAEGWRLDSSRSLPSVNNASQNRRFDINEISALILDHCDGEQSVASIIQNLQLQFPEADAEIPGDVESVLLELQQKQVLAFVPKPSEQHFEVPKASPGHDRKKLCIGMATYDDYDGVYFSVQAIRLYHPEILDQIEIIVIDNHPDGPCAEALKQLQHWVPDYRYVPCQKIRGTAVRDFIFREANADYVLCIDSHVMIEQGAIEKLLDYFDQHPACKDFLQGPLLNDDLKNISTHFEPGWSQGMFGTWGMDPRALPQDAAAFDIPMQGLGLFACAKSAWPGFNPRFSGFGGEEGYIHEKVRQHGGRTLCLPFLRWLHRFNRPMGTRYSVSWEDRIRNYLIGRDELGLEDQDVIEHFNEHIGEDNTQQIVDQVREEIRQPYYYFDALYCLVDESSPGAWQRMQLSLKEQGVLRRVMPVVVSNEMETPQIARTLAMRDILLQAQQGGYQSILIFDETSGPGCDDPGQPLIDTDALNQYDWQLFYPSIQLEPEANALEGDLVELKHRETDVDSPIVVHQRAYAQLLADMPAQQEAMGEWLEVHGSLAQYFDHQLSTRLARRMM